MSFPARDKAISNFATNDNCNILLAPLRCGGRKSSLNTPPIHY